MMRFFLLLLLSVASFAQDTTANVTIAWDANQEADLAGYRVYWGAKSGEYTQSAEATTNRARRDIDDPL